MKRGIPGFYSKMLKHLAFQSNFTLLPKYAPADLWVN